MEPLSLTLILSTFLAGVLMFLAPCTLPLLPAYLGFLSGVTQVHVRDGVTPSDRVRILQNALMFVLGFTAVFTLFGMLAGVAGALLAPLRHVLVPLGGTVIIVFGLFMIGALKLDVLMKERRLRLPAIFTLGTPLSALLLGAAFAFGWTPCVGPILGTVLFYASSADTLLAGALLLTVFSLGFAVPFLLLALLISQSTRIVEIALPALRIVSILGGIILILLGLNLVLGDTMLTQWFFRLFDGLDFEDVLLRYL